MGGEDGSEEILVGGGCERLKNGVDAWSTDQRSFFFFKKKKVCEMGTSYLRFIMHMR